MKKALAIVLLTALMAVLLCGCSANTAKDQETGGQEGESMATYTIDVVETDGVVMPYAKIGDGAKTLVLVPGLSVKQVSPLAEAIGAQYQQFLDAGYSVYVFDSRTNAADGYSVEDMADDTAACMAALGIEQADVAGMSLGGMVAQLLAAQHPEMVDHLMLCSTFASHTSGLDNHVAEWIGLAKAKQEAGLAESFGKLVYSDSVWEANKDAIVASCSNITDEEYARFIRNAEAILTFDSRDKLGAVTAKALVVGSEGDALISLDAMKELTALLDCDSYFYDSAYGHAVYDEAPDFVGRLLAFCQER